MRTLSRFAELSEGAVSRVIDRTIDNMFRYVTNLQHVNFFPLCFTSTCRHFEETPAVQLLDVADWQACHPQNLQEAYKKVLFYFVDGTVVGVGESGDPDVNRDTWNTKHQIHAFAFFVLVAPNGRIVYLSDVYFGNVHDKTAWEESTVLRLLKQKYSVLPNDLTFAIGGDKAYPHMTVPDGWFKYITKSGEKEVQSKLPNLRLDAEIAKFRAVVERAIGKLKDYQVLHNPYYLGFDTVRVYKIVFILANLVNQTYTLITLPKFEASAVVL